MRSKLKIITMSWWKAVTFDLIRHGLRPVTPSPPGEGFGRCFVLIPTTPHPAGIAIPATFPQGKASLRWVGTLTISNRTPPPSPSVTPPPTRREATPCRFLRMEFQRAGHATAPTLRNDTAYRPSSVCPKGQPLSSGMTATGSHIDSYSLRGAQPPGERLPETRLFFPVSIVVRKPATVNGFPHFLLFPKF